MNLTRHTVFAGGRQVHYRRMGRGPALVMLHPSPQSSLAMVPVMEAFAPHFTVFALDTPGYGLSDGLAEPASHLHAYGHALKETLDALGLEKPCLFGQATGAQIGIAFAQLYPERVGLLALDSAGHFPDDQVDSYLDGYMPDVAVRRDGGHLLTLWDMVRHLFVFFPWQHTTPAARRVTALPPAPLLHALLTDYLRAGANYAAAYRLAFFFERPEELQKARVPGLLNMWADGLPQMNTQSLIDHGLPPDFQVVYTGHGVEARRQGMIDAIKARYSAPDVPPLAPGVSAGPAGAIADFFAGPAGLQLRWRGRLSGDGPLLLLLPDAGAGAQALDARIAAAKGPVLAVDPAGQGESALPPSVGLWGAEEHAAAMAAGLALLWPEGRAVEILAQGASAPLAAALVRQTPGRFQRLTLVEPPVLTAAEAASFLAQGLPDLSPCPYGRHLLLAWSYVRDRHWFWPWFSTGADRVLAKAPALDWAQVHVETAELLKQGNRFHDLWRLALAAPLPRLLDGLDLAITLAAPEGHPLLPRLQALAAEGPAHWTAAAL